MNNQEVKNKIDAEISSLSPIADWWKNGGKKFVFVLAIGAFAGLIAWAIYARSERLDKESSAIVFKQNMPVEEIEQAVQKYSDRKVGPLIKLKLAKAYFDNKQYEKALASYEALIAEKSLPAVYDGFAEFGAANSCEMLFRWADAAKYYGCIQSGHFYYLDATMRQARCSAFVEGADKGSIIKSLEDRKNKEFKDNQYAQSLVDNTIDTIKRWKYRKPVSEETSSDDGVTIMAQDSATSADAPIKLPAAAPAPAAAAPAPAK